MEINSILYFLTFLGFVNYARSSCDVPQSQRFLHNRSGFVTSPNFDNHGTYPKNQKCKWKINAVVKHQAVVIDFNYMDVLCADQVLLRQAVPYFRCGSATTFPVCYALVSNHLSAWNCAREARRQKVCNSKFIRAVRINDAGYQISFRSDEKYEGRGFNLSYHVIDCGVPHVERPTPFIFNQSSMEPTTTLFKIDAKIYKNPGGFNLKVVAIVGVLGPLAIFMIICLAVKLRKKKKTLEYIGNLDTQTDPVAANHYSEVSATVVECPYEEIKAQSKYATMRPSVTSTGSEYEVMSPRHNQTSFYVNVRPNQ